MIQGCIPTKDIGIYVNANTIQHQFESIANFSFKFDNFYTDIDKFLQDSSNLKFAGFHVPFPRNTDWIEDFHRIRPHVNHVFIFCSELHNNIVEDLVQLDYPDVTMFLCGFIEHKFKYTKIEQWFDWFITSSYFYTDRKNNFLKENLRLGNKKYYFDILLGTKKPHRDLIYNYVIENKLTNKMIMTYHKRFNMDLKNSDQFILEEKEIEYLDNNSSRTSQQIRYHGIRMVLSQVIPLSIYNQTYYSVVAETCFENHFTFYTEKIVKPLLAGRLFIFVGSRYFLRNLKSLGFKTFNNVVDESYDVELDPETRWSMALDQMQKLCNMDPTEVQDKIKDAVVHNQRLMTYKEWATRFDLKLHDYLLDYITTAHIADDWQGSWPLIRT